MPASNAELDLRVRALESRQGRLEEDQNALIDTAAETLTRVQRLETKADWNAAALGAIAAHLGVTLPEPPAPADEADDVLDDEDDGR